MLNADSVAAGVSDKSWAWPAKAKPEALLLDEKLIKVESASVDISKVSVAKSVGASPGKLPYNEAHARPI